MREVIIKCTDDLDRVSPATEVIELAIDGWVYELDLTDEHAKELREFLSHYTDNSHDRWRMPPRPDRKRKKSSKTSDLKASDMSPVLGATADPTPLASAARGKSFGTRAEREHAAKMGDRAARKYIREWAKVHGHPCSDVGKIPAETLLAFRIEEPNGYIPLTTLIDAGLAEAQ